MDNVIFADAPTGPEVDDPICQVISGRCIYLRDWNLSTVRRLERPAALQSVQCQGKNAYCKV